MDKLKKTNTKPKIKRVIKIKVKAKPKPKAKPKTKPTPKPTKATIESFNNANQSVVVNLPTKTTMRRRTAAPTQPKQPLFIPYPQIQQLPTQNNQYELNKIFEQLRTQERNIENKLKTNENKNLQSLKANELQNEQVIKKIVENPQNIEANNYFMKLEAIEKKAMEKEDEATKKIENIQYINNQAIATKQAKQLKNNYETTDPEYTDEEIFNFTDTLGIDNNEKQKRKKANLPLKEVIINGVMVRQEASLNEVHSKLEEMSIIKINRANEEKDRRQTLQDNKRLLAKKKKDKENASTKANTKVRQGVQQNKKKLLESEAKLVAAQLKAANIAKAAAEKAADKAAEKAEKAADRAADAAAAEKVREDKKANKLAKKEKEAAAKAKEEVVKVMDDLIIDVVNKPLPKKRGRPPKKK